MIMRGNLVYNNWNRIPFYVTQLPDNSGNTNPNYGTKDYNNILDGQGLYVTRSDPAYNGTFLFENNVCVNNGKNGINFDNSLAASAIFQNNTLYYNGVHEIIQDLSVAQGNEGHRGQKVGGIKANKVLNATVVNNIIVTRDNVFSAIELPNISGSRPVNNNIFFNGKVPSDDNGVPYNFISCCNMLDIDPLFTEVPLEVNGAIDIRQTNFELIENSPAINAGNPNFSPISDIVGNIRPVSSSNSISSTSFEDSSDGWSPWGASISLSSAEAKTGSKSLFVSNRAANWHSPRIYLNDLLTVGNTYTFYVSVKLPPGASGTADLTIRSDVAGSDPVYTSFYPSPVAVSDEDWTILKADYTHSSEPDNFWFYVKGPSVVDEVGSDFYIDDFSLVPQGSAPVDFMNSNDVVDIGAYEFRRALSTNKNSLDISDGVSVFPNPSKNKITVSGINSDSEILIFDVLGKNYKTNPNKELKSGSISLNISALKAGIYIIKIVNKDNSKSIKFIKE